MTLYRINSEGNGHRGSITCMVCGRTSHHPDDVRNRYCAACHQFHDHRTDLAPSADLEGPSHFDIVSTGEIVAGHGDWFSARLLRLIAATDPFQRRRIATVYPRHVAAFEAWETGNKAWRAALQETSWK